MPIRSAATVFLGLAAIACQVRPTLVLLPSAAEPVRAAFDLMRPALVWDDIKIDRAQVRAVLCPQGQPKTSCFSILLRPPGSSCGGRETVAFCVVPASPRSDGEWSVIDSALGHVNVAAVWTVEAPPKDSGPVAGFAGRYGAKLAALAFLAGVAAGAVRFRRRISSVPASLSGVPRTAFLELQALGREITWGWRGAAGAAAVALVSFLVLNRFDSDPATFGGDGTIWFLRARDCLELGSCSQHGARTSFGFDTGTVWVDLLMLVQLVHGTSVTVRSVDIGLYGVAVGTVFVVLWRWMGWPVAGTAAGALVFMLSVNSDAARVWNPSLAFFPNALCFASLLVSSWTGRLSQLGSAAFFLSLAINTHLSAAVLLPPLLMIAIIRASRPMRAVTQAIIVLAAVGWVTSPGSTAINTGELLEKFNPAWLVLAVAVTAAGALGLRPFFLRSGIAARAFVVALSIVLSWWFARRSVVTMVSPGRDDSYSAPVLAPVAVLGALTLLVGLDLLARKWMRRPLPSYAQAAVGIFACAVLWGTNTQSSDPGEVRRQWTREDARTLDAFFERGGWDAHRLRNRLESSACWNLYSGIQAYSSRPAIPASGVDPFRSLRVWLLDEQDAVKAAVPLENLGMNLVPLRHHRTAAVSQLESWLDFNSIEFCQPSPVTGQNDCRAVDTSDSQNEQDLAVSGNPVSWYPPLWRSADRAESLIIPFASSDETRIISVLNAPSRSWVIARVEGLDFVWIHPADKIQITGRPGVAGKLIVERGMGHGIGWDPFPPCFMEERPSESSALTGDLLAE